jgi:hypothetical protein
MATCSIMARISLAAIVLLLSVSAVSAWAQTASLSGEVTDPSGAKVDHAQVTITSQSTHVRTNTVSHSDGIYEMQALQPGRYTVRVDSPGFASFQQTGVLLEVDTAKRLDFALKTGATTSVITVTANNNILQPNNDEVETHISEKEYEDLPLLQLGRNRNPSTFLYLVPGVQGATQLNGGEYTGATNVINVNGSQEYTTELLVEGLPGGQSRIAGNFTESSPPADAISEFKMTTTGLPAEYGHTGAAVGSFTVKSGTNALHGSVYEYFRNSALDAVSWLAKHNNAVSHSTKQNEFGVTIGGPVVIPHLYNGKDRTFFFFSYGGSRLRGANTFSQVQIPTLAEKQGYFTVTGAPTANAGIYDPATTTLSGGAYTRNKFPIASSTATTTTYFIDPRRFDPVAQAVLKLYPDPNQAGTLNYGGWTGNPLLDPNLFTTKIDHVLTERQHLSATYIRTVVPRTTLGTPLPAPLGNNSYQVVASHTGRLNHNWMITPALLNSAYFGFDRFTNINLPLDKTPNYPSRIGFPGSSFYFPTMTFSSGYTSIASASNSSDVENDFYYKDQMIWQLKKHTLTYGGEWRKMQYNDQSPYTFNGTYGFSTLETGNPASQSGTGNGLATFLLGQVDSGTVNEPVRVAGRKSYWGFFIQDDFRLTPRLTFNIGFRDEWQPPYVEAHDHMSAVSLTTPNPGAGNRLGALVFAGPKPLGVGSRHLFPGDHSSLSPRFGFAFSATPSTVIRGAYGIYYSDPYYNGYSSVITSGYQVTGTFASPNNGVSPAFVASNGVPQTYPTTPTLLPTGVNGQSASYYDNNMAAMPRAQDWNFNIQQQLTSRSVITFAYIGSHGTRLINPNLENINQVDPKYLSLGSVLTQNINSGAAAAAGVGSPYPGFSGTVAQALRPYPQYLTLSSVAAKAGASIYHSGQVVYEVRSNWGLLFHAGYTYSKDMGYASPSVAGTSATTNVLQNAYDPQTEWAVLPQDVRHALVFYYSYPLPFGPNQRFLNHGFASKIGGGWQLSGIQNYQSGTPLGIVTNNTLAIFNSVLRPNINVGEQRSLHISNNDCDPSKNCIFNNAAFSNPAANSFGNASLTYSDLRNFAVLSENFSLVKETQISERVSWSLYGQSLNVLNRHRFYAIQSNFANANFGIPSSVTMPRQIQLGTRIRF